MTLTFSQVRLFTRRFALCLMGSLRLSSRVLADTSQRQRELIWVLYLDLLVHPLHDGGRMRVSRTLTQP